MKLYAVYDTCDERIIGVYETIDEAEEAGAEWTMMAYAFRIFEREVGLTYGKSNDGERYLHWKPGMKPTEVPDESEVDGALVMEAMDRRIARRNLADDWDD